MGILEDHLGEWSGRNDFRLTPFDEPHEAAATATVSAAAGGLLTQIAYTWSHPESGEQSGLLVLSPGEEEPAVAAMWGDTFHQSAAATWLTGAREDGSVVLGYTYAGDWQWRIVIDAPELDRLTIRMDNVVPDSAAAEGYQPGVFWAMRAQLGHDG